MKILVTAKRVVDPDSRLKILEDGKNVDPNLVEYRINYFDENAAEEALRLKEEHGGEIVAVSLGGDEVVSTMRASLAMGVDRGIRVDIAEEELDSDLAARVLAEVYRREEPDLVLMGKQAVDGDNNQVGQLLAEYLQLPQACFASEVKLGDGEATVTREVDGGLETIAVQLPAVVTADLRLNEPRYASLPGIMKAKKKQVDVLGLDDLGIQDRALKVELTGLEYPPERQGGQFVESVDELVDKLANEARVI